MVTFFKFVFFSIFFLMITSCFNEKKTAYERFVECNSKQSNSPNKDMHTEICFTKFSEVDYWSTDIINGNCRATLPSIGDYNTCNLFNRTDELKRVETIVVYVEEKNTTPVVKSAEIKLECEKEILYPKKNTKVRCYNFNSESDALKEYNKINKKKNVDHNWRPFDIRTLSIKN